MCEISQCLIWWVCRNGVYLPKQNKNMKQEEHKEMKRDEVCCENFTKIALRFNWMSYTDEADGKTVFVMPHIKEQERWRVNYCPICGGNVRDIKLTNILL